MTSFNLKKLIFESVVFLTLNVQCFDGVLELQQDSEGQIISYFKYFMKVVRSFNNTKVNGQ